MFREYLAQSNLLFLPLIGLVVSFFAFTAILVRLYVAKRRGESFDRVAALPLEEDGVRAAGSSPAGTRKGASR